MAETNVRTGGNWSVGYSQTGIVLKFEGGDQERPLEFGLSRGQAENLAQAILYQLDTPPPNLQEMN
jgi:hypothetical protein